MTREQLDAIRRTVTTARDQGFTPRLVIDLEALLAEVERLTALTEAINPCRLIDVGDDGVSRKRAEADAFKRGVAAMREALLQRFDWHGDVADRIRAEPVPEDKP